MNLYHLFGGRGSQGSGVKKASGPTQKCFAKGMKELQERWNKWIIFRNDYLKKQPKFCKDHMSIWAIANCVVT